MKHLYGPQVQLIDHVIMNGVLAKLCLETTVQPEINRLVSLLYTHLFSVAAQNEFRSTPARFSTRMAAMHPEIHLEVPVIDPSQKAVVVNLARAGTWPSHVGYDFLHHVLPPSHLRQDHIMAARITDASDAVTGAQFGGLKIGGDVKRQWFFSLIPWEQPATPL